jgi:uncharacterized protein
MASEQDIVSVVQRGYAFDTTCIELGALVVDGQPRADAKVRVPLAMLNRHGLIAGATGTGKTVTLQVIAEQLSDHGVPVFAADIKGDLTGLASPGTPGDKLTARTEGIGQAWEAAGYPVELLRLGDSGVGVPVRATVTSFGPTLLAKVLRLNQTQESSLGLVFHYADQAGLPLLDLKDLRAVVQHLISDEGKSDLEGLGGLAKQTAGVILRELVNFAAGGGGEEFFGEPEFDVHDLLRAGDDGRGVITLLELPGVHDKPVLFSTFLMWLLAELFEVLREVGDQEKPKLVFFFEEAHLLFTGASRDFLAALIQTARLIRSKGVGVFFVTQTPKDVHEDVLSQLGSRVQHQLRAFTPNDADALRASVRTYPTSSYDLEQLLQELGIGEAVVTVMSERGAPTPVAHTMLPAPQSLMAPSDEDSLNGIVQASPLTSKYREPVDRDSAYEMLLGEIAAGEATGPGRAKGTPDDAAPAPASTDPADPYAGMTEEQRLEAEILGKLPPPPTTTVPSSPPSPVPSGRAAPKGSAESLVETFLKSAAESLGREISRGVFGNRRRRR